MTEFESSIRQIPHKQTSVFTTLSDLNNVGKLQGRLPEDQFEDLQFNSDNVSINVHPVGKVTMRIAERDEPKCIKYETVDSFVPFNLWVQLLPVTETSCKMKLTIQAELNMFIKGIISKPLQDALEKLADALSMIPYEDD